MEVFFSYKVVLAVNSYRKSIYFFLRNVIELFNTREIPAFGGISLALRGSSTFGAPVGVPAVPIWETAAFGGGERIETKQNIKNLGCHERPIFGAPGAPRSGRQLSLRRQTVLKT